MERKAHLSFPKAPSPLRHLLKTVDRLLLGISGMSYFTYRKRAGAKSKNDIELFAEDVSLLEVAKRFGTPCYVYSFTSLTRRYQTFSEAVGNAMVCYSVKANDNLAVLKTLASEGAGADIVSGGELKRALAAGICADKIVFSGVGKTESELAQSLDAKIGQFNIESEDELELLARIALEKNVEAPIAIRINPDIEAKTHDKISTGRAQDKFGIDINQAEQLYAKATKMRGISVLGLAMHIGSQLTSLLPFEMAFTVLTDLCLRLRSEGNRVSRLDLGGGVGISYKEGDKLNLQHYGLLVKNLKNNLGVDIILEPGRWMAGPTGILLSEVVRIKRSGEITFVILDMAMNDLLRPALYGAWHDVQPVTPNSKEEMLAEIVGPICESSDVIASKRRISKLVSGDFVAVRDVGAYGAVMSSNYNTRIPATEVMVSGKQMCQIRKRPNYEDILNKDIVPDWL